LGPVCRGPHSSAGRVGRARLRLLIEGREEATDPVDEALSEFLLKVKPPVTAGPRGRPGSSCHASHVRTSVFDSSRRLAFGAAYRRGSASGSKGSSAEINLMETVLHSSLLPVIRRHPETERGPGAAVRALRLTVRTFPNCAAKLWKPGRT
jgi:hypothetical protein